MQIHGMVWEEEENLCSSSRSLFAINSKRISSLINLQRHIWTIKFQVLTHKQVIKILESRHKSVPGLLMTQGGLANE